MSFGTNIQYLRKRENMTQEELAEKMDVSRQTVSKWESDASFPETDKIIQLCDLFSCSMDTLMRGNIEDLTVSDTADYDLHHNRFSAAIAAGSALVLAGVTLLLLLYALGVSEVISVMIFMMFVVASVTVFIISGIGHNDYVKKHPQIKPFYSQNEIDLFNRKFPYLIAIPTALILIGVIWIIGSSTFPIPYGFDKDRWDTLLVVPLMLFITAAVAVYVFAGMQKSKYDIDTYNQEHAQNAETLRHNDTIGKWCGCIMLIATAIFLLLGFLGNYWDICWVVFPVGGIACGIVSILVNKK